MISELIKVKPYDHQIKASVFAIDIFTGKPLDEKIHYNGCAFLMEMGCGKTLASIIVAGYLFNKKLINKVLIVCPLSITGVWEDEFKKFANYEFKTHIIKGSSPVKKKKELDQFLISYESRQNDYLQVVIVNYETSWRMLPELITFNPDLIIADEGHKLKENRSKQSQGMHKLGDLAKYKMLLTGTVITNKEIDVYSQYRFVDPQVFGTNFFAFRNRYFEMGGYQNHIPIFKEYLKPQFLEKMHSIAFRVTKAECLDLPEIIEEERFIELEDDAYKKYKTIEKDCYLELGDMEVNATNILTKMLRLSQAAGGFVTLENKENPEHTATKSISTAKLDALNDIIDLTQNENKKIVIIARFIAELDAIEELLKKKKINFAHIRGGVKDQTTEWQRFQNDDTCTVFVGQIQAAGLGITLTKASTMVFYSLDYSMSNFEQCKARIHRSGQTEKCHYIYLIAKGTLDRKVLKALKNKDELARELVDEYRNGINPFSEE